MSFMLGDGMAKWWQTPTFICLGTECWHRKIASFRRCHWTCHVTWISFGGVCGCGRFRWPIVVACEFNPAQMFACTCAIRSIVSVNRKSCITTFRNKNFFYFIITFTTFAQGWIELEIRLFSGEVKVRPCMNFPTNIHRLNVKIFTTHTSIN